MYTIQCRAKVTEDCEDGKPVESVYEDGMEDDATFSDGTVVCNTCYISIEPFMRMSTSTLRRDIPYEADLATSEYMSALHYVRASEFPELLMLEAADNATWHKIGSLAWTSATACYKLAREEVERRQNIKFEE